MSWRSRSHVAQTGWFPQLFRGGRYLTELFYAIVTSLKCGEHQRADIFTASNYIPNSIASLRFSFLEPNISLFFYLCIFISHLSSRSIFFFRSEEWTECFSKHFRKALYRTLVIASCRYSRETNYRRGESSAGNLNVSSIGESWNCADFMQLHDCI